ncbi:MAG: adenosylcobinamide-GDP ribazoletransferase [Desulfobulbaceae bacterium]|nr:adenosylcobinamide-GDP ribazoletransferase [Desulfobulbaceae bacterium]
MWNALRIALAFLTRLPVRMPVGVSGLFLARSSAFFPLIGWLVGGMMAVIAWAVLVLGGTPLLAAVLAVTASAWLTRGLHLDGVADLCDGLGGSHEPARRLAIMKDSATGAFGVIGVVLLLLIKVAALTALLAQVLVPARCGVPILAPSVAVGLLVAPAAARWAMASLAFGSRYPREIGTGHAFVGQVRAGYLLAGLLFLFPLLSLAVRPALVGILCAQLPAVWLRFKCNKALGGITGDVLGAACELGEAAGWLGVVLLAPWL